MAQTEKLSKTTGLEAVKYLVLSTRPRQWSKNIIIYFAFFFTVNQRWKLGDVEEMAFLFGRTTLAFLLFCLLSGAVYLINDLVDVERDRRHPWKRERPLASGRLGLLAGVAGAGVLAGVSLGLSFMLGLAFGAAALTYFVAMLAYSLVLKKVVILDVLAISAGFVLRAAAGAVVISAPVSPWLYVTTSLGALFLGFGKRRNELVLAGGDAAGQRETLSDYTAPLLDQLIPLVASATLIAYILYTFTAENLPANHAMMLTIPFVMFGLFRYLYLIHRRNLGESPEEVLFTDVPLVAGILLWLGTAAGVLMVFR